MEVTTLKNVGKAPKLDLNTRLSFEGLGYTKTYRIVEVGEVLLLLLKVQEEKHPDGFLAAHARPYLLSVFGDLVDEISGYHTSPASLYHRLVESGYAESSKIYREGSIIDTVSTRARPRYVFIIKREALQGYKQPKTAQPSKKDTRPDQVELPGGLVLLMKSLGMYREYNGGHQDQELKNVLEEIVFGDDAFLMMMKIMQRTSPEEYAQMGGKYLTRLRQYRGQDRGRPR